MHLPAVPVLVLVVLLSCRPEQTLNLQLRLKLLLYQLLLFSQFFLLIVQFLLYDCFRLLLACLLHYKLLQVLLCVLKLVVRNQVGGGDL